MATKAPVKGPVHASQLGRMTAPGRSCADSMEMSTGAVVVCFGNECGEAGRTTIHKDPSDLVNRDIGSAEELTVFLLRRESFL